MRTIYSDTLLSHRPAHEFHRGELVPSFEIADRAAVIRDAVAASGLGPIEAPSDLTDDTPLVRVHRPEFVEFLRTAHDEWRSLGREGDAFPGVWPVRGLRSDRIPTSLDGRLSYYSFDMATPITEGSWSATYTSAAIAVTCAAALLSGAASRIFGLCRPPGHHAGYDVYGGYCYLNGAAIAAQFLRDHGMDRVAILDVDYHHGNGTQQIFYERSDVAFASIHADPATDYPYFLGYADEHGAGAGEGATHNYPLPRGTAWPAFGAALGEAAGRLGDLGPDGLVVSLGVDTFAGDPISSFALTGEDYRRMGERIAKLAVPTMFVMEGGYAVAELGDNVVEVLRGFVGG